MLWSYQWIHLLVEICRGFSCASLIASTAFFLMAIEVLFTPFHHSLHKSSRVILIARLQMLLRRPRGLKLLHVAKQRLESAKRRAGFLALLSLLVVVPSIVEFEGVDIVGFHLLREQLAAPLDVVVEDLSGERLLILPEQLTRVDRRNAGAALPG